MPAASGEAEEEGLAIVCLVSGNNLEDMKIYTLTAPACGAFQLHLQPLAQ